MDEVEQAQAEHQPDYAGTEQAGLQQEMQAQLTALGIEAQLPAADALSQLLTQHLDLSGKFKQEGQRRQEAERKLESLELSKVLGSEEITAEAREKLSGMAARSTAIEDTLSLLLSEGLVSEGIAELLRLGDSRAAAAAIKLGVKPNGQQLTGEQLVAEVTRQVKRELGLGEDLGEPKLGVKGAGEQESKRPSFESAEMQRARGFIANFKLRRGA
jgi:hypothetical protein